MDDLNIRPNDNEPEEPKITSWADIESLTGPITFEWYPWLPAGLLTILASDAGVGKSALALRLAGCYTKGLPWPDGTPFNYGGGTVLWCESEAAQAVNLDRAKKWQLPIDHFMTPFSDPLQDVNLDDKGHMATVSEKALHQDVVFIVVDSLSGSSNRKESETDVKRVTEFLARLARDSGKPILLTHHLRKRGIMDGDTVTLDRLRGSSAIVQAARVVWALDKPNPGSDRKRLTMVKNNLARFSEPIGVDIDESGVTFGDAPHVPRDETMTDRAADFLLALLTPGPMKAVDIENEFKHMGISWRTVNQAKKAMHIQSIRKADGWYWSLPAIGKYE